MKTIQKEVKRIEHVTMYQAPDGTEFNSADECLKYENSAKGVMRSRISDLIVYDSRNTSEDAWSILGGMDDNDIIGVKMNTMDDFNTVCQFFLLESPWYNGEERKEQRNAKIKIIKEAFCVGDIVLFGITCDDDCYIINSRMGIINTLNSLEDKYIKLKENKAK